MKTLAYFLLTTLLMLILASCSQGLVFRLFNNTGTDLIVICYDTQMVPQSYSIKAGENAEIEFPSQLMIKGSSGAWTYGMLQPDRMHEYVKHMRRIEELQIETNGTIYVLATKTGHTVKQFPRQPAGFPLTPTSSGR